MNSPEQVRAAHDRGVATSYRATGAPEATVAPATIEAILAALGDPPASYRPEAEADAAVAAAGAPAPERRAWGVTIQLYAVRSAAPRGHGGLPALSDRAAWSARELGAGFVLINPLHAAEPVVPVSP